MPKVFTPEEFAEFVKQQPQVVKEGIQSGLTKTVRVIRDFMRIVTKDEKLVDLGLFKRNWTYTAFPQTNEFSVYNGTPYAATLELGARPHVIPEWERMHLLGWVLRHFLVDTRTAERIVSHIANKIACEGIRARFFVLNNMGHIIAISGAAIYSELDRAIKKHGG